jgi:TonB family protein
MILAIVRSSTILLIAFAVLGIGGRRLSAAVRHLILTVALLASLVVPFLPPLFPPVFDGLGPRSVTTRQETRAEARDYIFDSVGSAGSLAPPDTARRSFAFYLWIGGSVVSVMFIIAGMLRVFVQMRRASILIDGRWDTAVNEIVRRFGIKRRLRLLQNQGAILGTWGVIRPGILLPYDVDSWTDDRLRIVLTHEVAHIKRLDWLVQILGELARAANWFNPLFWFLCRRLRSESEHACDDVVLNAGFDAREYATHLLELARSLKTSGQTWSPVLAMAQPPHLERRFIAMLNPSINRKSLNRRAVVATCILALLVMIPLGGVQAREELKLPLVVTLPPAPPSPAPVSAVKSPAVAPRPARKKVAAAPAPAQGLGSLSGTVTDWTGAVIPGVLVTIFSRTVSGNSVTETEVVTRPSDETGAFNFPALTPGQYSLKAELPGFSTYRSVLQVEVGQVLKEKVTLSVGGVTQRVLVTAVGQPRPAPFPGTPQRIRVGGNVIAANLISQVKPFYPQSARDAGIEGVVHLQGLIGTDGTLIGLSPLNFINTDLMNAAMDAVRQWRYKPTLLNNEPVQVLTTIDVEFKLAQ